VNGLRRPRPVRRRSGTGLAGSDHEGTREQSGRYGDRAAEVAARTVQKQHKEKGHKKGT
jgi:hypothetical protein